MTTSPPIAPRKQNTDIAYAESNDDQHSDPYHWLQDKDDPEVIAYLKDENNYCQQVMEPTLDVQEQLYQELLGRIRETDLSVPYQWQDYEYFTRTIQGQDYEQHWRRNLDTGQEQLLLDENSLAANHDFFELGCLEVSPDQNLLAYCVDTTGDERYQVKVLDPNTEQLLKDSLNDCSGNLIWSMDSKGFHYGVLNDQQRPFQLRTHQLGTSQEADSVLFEELDERYFIHGYRSKSDAYLIVESGSKTSTEVWYGAIATLACGSLHCFSPRRDNHEYYVDHNGQDFIIRSNASGINFALHSTEHNQTNEARWNTLLPHSDNTTVEDIEILADFLVVAERIDGLARLRVLSQEPAAVGAVVRAEDKYLEFPEACCSLDCVDNVAISSNVLRVRYESLVSPASIWDIDLVSGRHFKLKEIEVVGGYDPERFKTFRTECPSFDNIKVPVTLVGLKSSFSQPAPTLLYGYGAYGESLDPWFSHARLNLLERGFIFAIAHVRGGGCLGEAWYHEGKLLQKKNSFEDFIACSRYLISQGFTSPSKLIISGGSAGGLLIGAVLNKAPELYLAAIADVPFVDVLNTMLDPDLPLTQTEYDEWGDPSQTEVYDYIASYSPIDNVKAQEYPHLLVTSGLEDTRVQFWEPTKWIAQLRHKKTDSNLLLLKTLMDSGHGGVSGRYDSMREIAFEQAFILKTLEI